VSTSHADHSEVGPPHVEEVSRGIYAYVQPDGSWFLNNTGFLVGRRAADGVISWVKADSGSGTSGNMLQLKADDGWIYWYIHINNDTPGTDDGLNPPDYRFAPGIDAGSRLKTTPMPCGSRAISSTHSPRLRS